jgi:NADPH2:quinone reductase
MKAAFIDKVGPPESIQYGELPRPAVGARQILVRVSAVALNPVDALVRSGAFVQELPRPFILGRDAVGVVEEIGRDVTTFSLGQRVWCNNQGYNGRQGTFAEFIAVDEPLLYPLPDGVDEREAVAFAQAGLTAHVGMQRAHIEPGESLFINGGSGNVGTALLQFAKAAGVRILATAGDARGVEWCRTIGADRAMNYKTDDLDKAIADFAPGGVDVHWNTSGRHDLDKTIARIARRGRIVIMSAQGEDPVFPVRPFYIKDATLVGFAITYATETELKDAAEHINAWMAAGKMRVRIDRVMKLTETAEAHLRIEEHAHISGKIVLVP